MKDSCVVNRKSVKENKALKMAQRDSRKYYKGKISGKAKNAPKTKIRKLADLRNIEGVSCAEIQIDDVRPVYISKNELVEICEKSHLTGRSGNGFLVSKKIEALKDSGGILIINGVECDPGLVTDSWLYRNEGKKIKSGAAILKEALGLKRIILATKEPLIEIEGIEQVKVADRFPLGYEKILIKKILGIEIGNEEIPQDKGIIVMNLQTVIAIDEITKNIDASHYKYITVADLRTASAKVIRVRIGDSIKKVAGNCYRNENSKLYAGSGALQCHLADENELVSETTGYIAFGKMPDYNDASKCKGCGRCTRNCPAGVVVHKVIRNRNDVNECTKYNVDKCIGCGACTYGCSASVDVRKVVTCYMENGYKNQER